MHHSRFDFSHVLKYSSSIVLYEITLFTNGETLKTHILVFTVFQYLRSRFILLKENE